MTLAPGDIAQFEAVLSTPDKKPPALGVYDLRVVVGEARQRVIAANGSPWSGLVPDATTVPLELREVRSAEDVRALENKELAAALLRGDHAEVLRAYQRQMARDPSDVGAHGGAGSALVALGRLAEAAAAYERALALGALSPSALSHSPYPERLAIVYFALRDDSKALATLRRHRPEADVQRAEKYLRQAATRLRTR
jgi:tetratricopeptide (TPR) repeat protein